MNNIQDSFVFLGAQVRGLDASVGAGIGLSFHVVAMNCLFHINMHLECELRRWLLVYPKKRHLSDDGSLQKRTHLDTLHGGRLTCREAVGAGRGNSGNILRLWSRVGLRMCLINVEVVSSLHFTGLLGDLLIDAWKIEGLHLVLLQKVELPSDGIRPYVLWYPLSSVSQAGN